MAAAYHRFGQGSGADHPEITQRREGAKPANPPKKPTDHTDAFFQRLWRQSASSTNPESLALPILNAETQRGREAREGGTDAPPARRPVGSATVTDACIRNRRTSHRRSAIERSPAVPPSINSTATSVRDNLLAPLRLCVFAFVYRVGGWVVWVRRQSKLMRTASMKPSVSICVICGHLLCGWAALRSFKISGQIPEHLRPVILQVELLGVSS
jgi:hypothetical protein